MIVTTDHETNSVTIDWEKGTPTITFFPPEFGSLGILTLGELLMVRNELDDENPIKGFRTKAAGLKSVSALLTKELANAASSDAAASSVTTKRKNTRLADTDVIVNEVGENPKRARTRAFEKFEVLAGFNGRTVGDFRKEEGAHPDLDLEIGWPCIELRWCIKKGFISLANDF